MSAFVHNKDHFDLIVTAALSSTYRNSDLVFWEPATKTNHELSDPDEIGRILLSENIRSVLYRYTDLPTDEMEQYADTINGYRFRRVEGFTQIPHHWLVALHACQSLSYQSCESDDYRDTKAAALLTRIQENIQDRLIREAKVNGWAWSRAEQLGSPGL